MSGRLLAGEGRPRWLRRRSAAASPHSSGHGDEVERLLGPSRPNLHASVTPPELVDLAALRLLSIGAHIEDRIRAGDPSFDEIR